MMKQIRKRLSGFALLSLFFLFAGCTQQPQEAVESAQQPQQSDINITEEPVPQQQPAEDANPDGAVFVAADGSVQLTLPTEGNWSKESESNNLISFVDPENGFLDIVCLSGEEADSTVIPDSEEAFRVTMQDDPSIGSYEVEFFDCYTGENGMQGYQVVVKYLGNESFLYTITNAVKEAGDAYIVNASLTTDDEEILAALKDTVASLQVLE